MMTEIEGEIEVDPTTREVKNIKLQEEKGKDHTQEAPLQVEVHPQVPPDHQDESISTILKL